MERNENLLQALRRLKVETGSIACMGCGYEHNCGIHGCAIIREATERLDAYEGKGMTVVRCKECEHGYDDLCGRVCSFGPCVDCIVPDDFYCGCSNQRKLT